MSENAATTRVQIVERNGKYFFITETQIPDVLPLSGSGKSRMVASTGGFIDTGVTYKGQVVKLNMSATVKA